MWILLSHFPHAYVSFPLYRNKQFKCCNIFFGMRNLDDSTFPRRLGGTASDVLEQFDRYESSSQNDHDDVSVYPFTPKWQKSTKNNPLCGICLGQWISLLWKRYDQIAWTTYWPRLVVLSLLSVLNSILALPEYFLYERRIRATPMLPRPVFILGHPRTGTTMLHSLLALDDDQFTVCNTFCAGFPSCFLWLETWGKILFRGVIDDTRPMDNVPLHFDLPQEDELATNVLCAGSLVSPYMPLWFMTHESDFRPYYAFDDNTQSNADEYLPPDQMAKARQTWTKSFLYLMQKLSLRDELRSGTKAPTTSGQHQQQRRRLLLKSPVHTARIPLLLQLFPDAQFIYIHRHPYDVFRSAAHMADTTYWYTYMTPTPSNEQIQEFILRQYEILWDRYQEGKQTLLMMNMNMNMNMTDMNTMPMNMDTMEPTATPATSSDDDGSNDITRQYKILWEQYQNDKKTLMMNMKQTSEDAADDSNHNDNNNILQEYKILWSRYQEGKNNLLSKNNLPSSANQNRLVEVSYDELSQNPLATIERIYQALGWTLSDQYRQQLLDDLVVGGERSSYQVNQHRPLPRGIQRKINQRWGPSFDILGYKKALDNEN